MVLDTSPNEPEPRDYPSPNNDSCSPCGDLFGHCNELRESTLIKALPCRVSNLGRRGLRANGCSRLPSEIPQSALWGHHRARIGAKNLGSPGLINLQWLGGSVAESGRSNSRLMPRGCAYRRGVQKSHPLIQRSCQLKSYFPSVRFTR